MKKVIFATIGLLFSVQASATGGFECRYTLDSLDFELGAVTSRSFENALVSAQAAITGQFGDDGQVRKVDYQFKLEDIRQYWNVDGELNVMLYAEKESATALDSSMKILIRTKSISGDENYTGTISIWYVGLDGAWDLIDAPVSCSVE